MPSEVYKKIMYWVNKSSFEVSGLGMLKVEPDGVVCIIDAILLPQKNTSVHTEIDAGAVAKAMYELRNSEGELRFWWHSHVKMPVSWSAEDHATIKELGDAGWIVSTVFNQKCELRSAFYSRDGLQTPWGVHPLFYDELETDILTSLPAQNAEWDAAYEKNVTNEVFTYLHHTSISGWEQNHTNAAREFEKEWERDAQGVWSRKKPIPISKKSTSGSDTSEAFQRGMAHITDQMRKDCLMVHSAKNRPAGVTKKQWQAIKRQAKDDSQLIAASTGILVPKPEDIFDVYGFDQDERTFLATHGLTDKDLDYLVVEKDFTPMEVLRLFEMDMTMQDIHFMIGKNCNIDDIMEHAIDQSTLGSI